MTKTAGMACNICGSMDHDEVKRGVFGNPDQNVCKCSACGHVFLGPLLDDAEEERFYIDEYPAFLLKRGDFKSTTPDEHFKRNKCEAERRYQLIKGLLGRDKDVLEIGSASGFFLDHVRPYVKSVCGIEPNAAHAGFANEKGIPTHAGIDKLDGKKFDLVFMYYVLEHIKDPVGFMKRLKTIMKGPGARAVIEVPNVREALVSVYGSKAYNEFVWQRAHCSYFSVEALTNLFGRAGLSAEFVPEQRYDISNHIYWLAAGKPGGTGKYSDVLSDDLNIQYAKDLKKKWLCDTILAIAGPLG